MVAATKARVEPRLTADDVLDRLAQGPFPKPAHSWLYEIRSESGPGARAMDLDWVRSLRDQCVAARVPFFFKQHALNGRKISTPELGGVRWTQMPRVAEGAIA